MITDPVCKNALAGGFPQGRLVIFDGYVNKGGGQMSDARSNHVLQENHQSAIVLFDGKCHFCNVWVTFIVRRDPLAHFRFASLQSDNARSLLLPYAINVEALDSVVLLESHKCYSHSTAVLRIFRKLKGPWKLCYVFILVPKSVRDAVYRWFAINRYRFFGKKEHCPVPTKEIRERLLDS
jgi:predicted DCC family thiol-disulfide oxidoreductase YuxK